MEKILGVSFVELDLGKIELAKDAVGPIIAWNVPGRACESEPRCNEGQ
jgi:hypothetical protein